MNTLFDQAAPSPAAVEPPAAHTSPRPEAHPAASVDAPEAQPKAPPEASAGRPAPGGVAAAAHAHEGTAHSFASEWFTKATEQQQHVQASGVVARNQMLEHIEGHLEEVARGSGKQEKRLLALVRGFEEHIAHIHETHGADAQKMDELRELLDTVRGIVDRHAGAENPFDAIYKEAEPLIRKHGVEIPGTLVYPENTPRLKEWGLRIGDHWNNPERGILSKGFSAIGTTVSLGVAGHGIANVKRGLFGYHDAETGEKRSGSLANVFVGSGEIFVGLLGVMRTLSGSWTLGRASHKAAHHHHDHGGHDHCGH